MEENKVVFGKFSDVPMGGESSVVAAVAAIEECTASNGASYCKVTAVDSDKRKEVISIWDTNSEILAAAGIGVGGVFTMKPAGKLYNGTQTYSMRGKSLKTCITEAPKEAKIEDFIISAPYEGEKLYDLILQYTDKFCSDVIKAIVRKVYEDNKDELIYWSAAKQNHHAYRAGLLWHSASMVEEAYMITKARRFAGINKSLVIGACAVHDIGKLSELMTDETGNAEYTVDGKLFGHHLIGYDMVRDAAKELGVLDTEETRQLLHIIISHHGQRDWGAVMLPATREAYLVHMLDMIDSHDEEFIEAYKALAPNEMSATKNFALDCCVFRPLFEEQETSDTQKGE